ncbi:flippase [Peribacillus frigoritolerans]|uniref:flippase n=1 Tax=Peribacillus frigoritolerans TaxID=450367 RepID=UPI00345D9A3A
MKKYLKKLKKNQLLANSGWIIFKNIVNMLNVFLVTSIVARVFGPSQFGEFNYVYSFVILFTALSTLGLDNLAVKTLIQKKEQEKEILFTLFIVRISSGILLILISNIIFYFLGDGFSYINLVAFVFSIMLFLKAFEVVEYWLLANWKSKVSTIIRSIITIAFSVCKIIVVLYTESLLYFSLTYLIESFVIGIILMFYYFKKNNNHKKNFNFNIKFAKYILKESWPLAISGLAITLYMRIDQIMIGILSDSTELGYYSAAVRIAEMWYFIPLSLVSSYSAIIMKIKDEIDLNAKVQELFNIVTWIGIIFAIFITITSPILVTILFGSEYDPSASIITISVWAGIFATLGSARSIWLVAKGLNKYSLIYTFSGLFVNVILNFLLIPIWGGKGAAFATLIGQFTSTVIVLGFFKQTRKSTFMIIQSFRIRNLKFMFNKFKNSNQ